MKRRHPKIEQRLKAFAPPYSLEMERAVIGMMLNCPDATLTTVFGSFDEDLFYDRRHRVVFKALLEMFNQNLRIDLLTVERWLMEKKRLKLAGGRNYFRKLPVGIWAPGKLERALAILHGKSQLRKGVAASVCFINRACAEVADAGLLLDEWELEIRRIQSPSLLEFKPHNLRVLMTDVLQLAEMGWESRRKSCPIKTGFLGWDRLGGGFCCGELVVLAGGRVETSALALNVVDHVLKERRPGVGFFSLTLPAHHLARRLACLRARVDFQKILTGHIAKDERQKFADATADIAASSLIIDDPPRLSVSQLRARAKQMIMQHGVKFIVIDSLQLVTSSRNDLLEASGIYEIVRLAKEHEVSMMAVSHTNRGSDSGSGCDQRNISVSHYPKMLRDEADWLVLVDEPGKNVQGPAGSKQITVSVRNGKNGVEGKLELVYWPGCGRFEELQKSKQRKNKK